jgi:hypothetical protein
MARSPVGVLHADEDTGKQRGDSAQLLVREPNEPLWLDGTKVRNDGK